MTTRPAKLPFLLCCPLVLVGCQQASEANGSQAIDAGVTTVHTSVADTVRCEGTAYPELEERVPEAARRPGPGDPIEIMLDRQAGTLSVSRPHVTVHPGGQIRWVSEHDWAVLFMKSPSSPLQNGKRVVEGPPQAGQPRGARIRAGPDAVCGKFDYTVVVEEGGRMYTLDPEVWVLRA